MWVATNDLPRSAPHPFYTRLNRILDQQDFDGYVEGLCQRFYADEGRPGLPPAPPDHSTISRTRRLIDIETHDAVFTWMLQRLAEAGLVKGKTVGIDATTLEANAALRSIVRRDTGESYEDFLTKRRRPRVSRRRRARIWRGSIGSGRRRGRTTIGPIRTIPTRRSRR